MTKLGQVEYTDRLTDGKGVRTTRDFLCSVVHEFITLSQKYHESVYELPFCYREIQALPFLSAAISNVTPAFIGEAPVKRNNLHHQGETSSGRVDYWACYRNTSYFIEAKHAFIKVKQQGIKDITDKWETAERQLSTLRDEREGWNITEHFHMIPLLIVPFYTDNEDDALNDSLTTSTNNHIIKELFSNKKNYWGALVRISKPYIGKYQYERSTEYHPAIGFYARITETF